MYVCPQCNEEYPALEPACPRCGAVGRDPEFLRGIPGPNEPPETLEDWVVVLRTPDEVQARLAQGFLQTQGIEAMIYPLEGATGFEPFGHPGIVEELALPGRAHPHSARPIQLLVSPESAPEALHALRELRDRPATLAGDEEDAGDGGEEPEEA